MKKFILFAAALMCMAGMTSSAHAQLPFPGQSLPVLIRSEVTYPTMTNGSHVLIYIEHESNNPNNLNPYWLHTEAKLYRKNTFGTWVYMGLLESDEKSFDANKTNTTLVDVSMEQVLFVEGPGDYKVEVRQFAYNPTTHVQIYLWGQDGTFHLSSAPPA